MKQIHWIGVRRSGVLDFVHHLTCRTKQNVSEPGTAYFLRLNSVEACTQIPPEESISVLGPVNWMRFF
jgi:hypothetical protein